MILAKPGTDIIKINEQTINENWIKDIPKIHLIVLDFFQPTEDKMDKVLDEFSNTNRFIIKDNIKFYNYTLKYTNKKYYVMNNETNNIITFFRKNNKVLLNMLNLDNINKTFVKHNIEDILNNIEIILINEDFFKDREDIFKLWKGNVIIHNEKYPL